MESNSGTQVIKGKELDASYTIPKKRSAECATEPSKGDVVTVMARTYDDVVQTPPSYQLGGGWQHGQQNPDYYTNYGQYDPQYSSPGGGNVSKRTREEPKTTRSETTYRDSFVDINDPTLPKELTSLFQPLYCKLCSAQLSSNVMAKMHYKSKNHDKKVRKFLIDYADRTGEPLHKRAKLAKNQNEAAEEYNPRYFHCDACDLPLTGKAHAESHYMGKNHQKVVMGKKAPAGKGCYNDDGKWIRTMAAKADPTGRDGFGQDFIVTRQEVRYNVKSDNALQCDLCAVSVTSLPQMEMHLQGQKHKKKVKQQLAGLSPDLDAPDAHVNGEAKGNQHDVLSAYRTPSGQFYCKTCNLSLNSETQFMQHLNSKKHLKKGNAKE